MNETYIPPAHPTCEIKSLAWKRPHPGGEEFLVIATDPLGKSHDLGTFPSMTMAAGACVAWKKSFRSLPQTLA